MASAVPESALSREVGTITARRLNMRKGPGRGQPIVKILHRGETVNIMGRTDGWLKVSYEATIGYIRNRKRYVHVLAAPEKQPERPKTVGEMRQKSHTIKKELKKQEAEVVQYSEKESTVINGLNDLEMALNKANLHVLALQSELDELEKQIESSSREARLLVDNIAKTEEYIALRLSALYKLDQLGKIQLLASAESVFDLLYRKFALEKILAHDEETLDRYLADKERLAKLSETLNQRKKEKLALEQKTRDQIRQLSYKRDKRKKILADVRNKKELALAAVESLKQAGIALDQTVLSLHVEPIPTKKKDGKMFAAYKGLLQNPVDGKVISFFGPYKNDRFNVTNYRSGIEIQADRGEPIRSVRSGQVLFSGWFKSYGNMIIIDHGNHYYTVYAHAEELFKKKGDPVETGEVIATVGDTASMTGTNLYFEVRHHGKPMDPLLWLKKG